MPADSNKQMTLARVKELLESNTEMISMQQTLRQAIFDAVSEADIKQIASKQIEKAKEGDPAALQFVMKYVLGFGQPITLNQINVLDVESAARIAGKKNG